MSDPAVRDKLHSPAVIRRVLAELNHRPSRSLGQNYLIDGNILDLIATAAEITPGEPVLEIGPGLGALTQTLLTAGAAVTAVEKDPAMVRHLCGWFQSPPLNLIQADALKAGLDRLLTEHGLRKVVANLPYSVGSRLLVNLTECTHRPQRMVLMLQQEVADRICAEPGGAEYGVLAVLVRLHYRVETVKRVSPRCFLPPPKVWSAVLRFDRLPEPAAIVHDYVFFKTLVKTAFSQRRKKLTSILRNRYPCPDGIAFTDLLEENGIAADARPEKLTLPQWAALANRLAR